MIECGEVNLIKADFSAFKYVFQCEYCGDDFGSDTTQRKYCSTSCCDKKRKGIKPIISSGEFKGFRYVNECLECHSAFGAMRSDKCYCSRSCQGNKWAKDNPEKLIIISKRKRVRNFKKINDAVRKWRSENPERVKKQRDEWIKANPEKQSEYDANQKIKKSQLATLDAISQIRNNNLINSTGETK